MVVPWTAYLFGEFTGLSGIVTIMICGFFMARYGIPNLSNQAKHSTYSIYHGISFNIEILVFSYMGLSLTGQGLGYTFRYEDCWLKLRNLG